MQYRSITKKEWEAAERLSSIAFWYRIDPQQIKENIEKDPDDARPHTRAAIDEKGTLVAKIELIPYTVWFDGKKAGMGGIGGVASRPEIRRGGHIRKLMTLALKEMNEEGMTFSYLYPFSFAFYGKFGYDPCAGYTRITAPLDQLLACPVEGSLTEYYPDDDLMPYVRIYEQFACARNMMVVRDEKRFSQRIKKDPEATGWFTWLYRAKDGTPKGYITYNEGKDNAIAVQDMAWVDQEGLNGLMGLLGRFTGNKKHVDMKIFPGFLPEVFWHNLHDVNCAAFHGGMNRIVNAQRALELCRVPAVDGACSVQVEDETCPWNTGCYRLCWKDGKSTVTRVDQPGDIKVNANALSALICGRLPLKELALLPWVELRGNEAMLEIFFPQKASCIQDYF